MARDLSPEYVLSQLEKGQLSPFYLFYGPSEFRREKVLNKIRETFIPEGARDFNLHLFYAVKSNPEDTTAAIIDAGRTLPFMSKNRLVIVRRTENFSAKALEALFPYLENPVESTCMIFVSSNVDFRKKFYKKIKELGKVVNFARLSDSRIVAWIKDTARDLGFDIDVEACTNLQQIVGNRLIDLYSELEKLYVRYGNRTISIKEVAELAIYSRTFSIFELMDRVSSKQCAESISALTKFLEEEGKVGTLKVLGMLNRQFKLLWQTKSVIENGGNTADVAQKLRLAPFQVKVLTPQSKSWTIDELERAFHLMYKADRLLKSGVHGQLVLENLVFSLCN